MHNDSIKIQGSYLGFMYGTQYASNLQGDILVGGVIGFPFVSEGEFRNHIVCVVEDIQAEPGYVALAEAEQITKMKHVIFRTMKYGRSVELHHEQESDGRFRGLFTLSLQPEGYEVRSHTFRTAGTFTTHDDARAGAQTLADAYQKAAGWIQLSQLAH